MSEVNKRGEFVFWRAFEGKHYLLREQAREILSGLITFRICLRESGVKSQGNVCAWRPGIKLSWRSLNNEISRHLYYQVDQVH